MVPQKSSGSVRSGFVALLHTAKANIIGQHLQPFAGDEIEGVERAQPRTLWSRGPSLLRFRVSHAPRRTINRLMRALRHNAPRGSHTDAMAALAAMGQPQPQGESVVLLRG